jgi:hypothetical protein
MVDPLNYRWAQRKLLVSLNKWITDGIAPAPSAVPRLDNGTLTARANLKFPSIPNVGVPQSQQPAYRADYGPDFLMKGIVTTEPPKLGSQFPTLIPQVDTDGNDVAGIRMPEIAVPLATFTGWNLFNERSGPTNVMANEMGSFIPFPRTKAERDASHDPRPSIEERYQSKDAYLALITKSADELAAKGYLIKEDIPRIVQQAGDRWNWVTSTNH